MAPADVADLPDDACGVVGDVGGQPRLELMTLGDRIVAVTIYEGSGMRTDSGLGIGSTEAEVSAGPLKVDRRTRSVALDGDEVSLTPKEFDLLVFLAVDAGAVRSRDEIIREVWDEHWWGSTKTLDVHVASLRRKLRPDIIETVRSVGYRLVVLDTDPR